MDSRFISKAELVKATRTSLSTVNRRIKDGEIPSIRLGSRILIPTSYLADLERLARGEVLPNA